MARKIDNTELNNATPVETPEEAWRNSPSPDSRRSRSRPRSRSPPMWQAGHRSQK